MKHHSFPASGEWSGFLTFLPSFLPGCLPCFPSFFPRYPEPRMKKRASIVQTRLTRMIEPRWKKRASNVGSSLECRIEARLKNRASYEKSSLVCRGVANEVSWSFSIESFWSGLPENLNDPASDLVYQKTWMIHCLWRLPLIFDTYFTSCHAWRLSDNSKDMNVFLGWEWNSLRNLSFWWYVLGSYTMQCALIFEVEHSHTSQSIQATLQTRR